MDAMIAWCNSLGGINGREIVGHRYDAALDNASQVIVESCAQDFMMVGQGFAGDEDMEADRIDCKLPMVPGFTLSEQRQQRADELRAAAVPGRPAQRRARRAHPRDLPRGRASTTSSVTTRRSPSSARSAPRRCFESVGAELGRLRCGAQVRRWRQLPGARPALPGVRRHGALRPRHPDPGDVLVPRRHAGRGLRADDPHRRDLVRRRRC